MHCGWNGVAPSWKTMSTASLPKCLLRSICWLSFFEYGSIVLTWNMIS